MKKFSKLLAVLSTVLALSSVSMPVSANADDSSITSFPLSERIIKKTDSFSPNVTCSFTISTDEETSRTKTVIGDTETGWYWGKNGLISFSESESKNSAEIRFTPETSETELTEVIKELPVYINTEMLEGDTSIKPNVYRFRISENITALDGVVNDSHSERFVYLYTVYKNGTDSAEGLKVEKVITTYEKDGSEVKTDSLEWSKDSDSETYEIRLKKKVTGNMGDKSADFNFSLNITPSDEGEK